MGIINFMLDQIGEFSLDIEDQKIDYSKLGWEINRASGMMLDDEIKLDVLENWEEKEEIRNKANVVVKILPVPPKNWAEYIKSFSNKGIRGKNERRMIIEALRAARCAGLVIVKDIRQKPQTQLANMYKNNKYRIGKDKAELLKTAFSKPKTTE